MTAARQLGLDFGGRPIFARDHYLRAACNAAAHDWVLRWPDWPAPALALYGPARSGKSHLAHIWAEIAGARIVDADDLTLESVAEYAGAPVALERAERVAQPRALLHLYNLQREARTHLLLLSRTAPARWPHDLPDLTSRLQAAPAVAIDQPDDALFGPLLVKLAADRQLSMPPEVVHYLTQRLERTFEAAEIVVSAIDRAALGDKRAVTVPLAGQVTRELRGE